MGTGGGGVSSGSRGRLPAKFSLGSQRMDDARTRLGLDQHENHSRCGLLCDRDSHWSHQEMVGKRSHGPAVEAGPRQLSRYS